MIQRHALLQGDQLNVAVCLCKKHVMNCTGQALIVQCTRVYSNFQVTFYEVPEKTRTCLLFIWSGCRSTVYKKVSIFFGSP